MTKDPAPRKTIGQLRKEQMSQREWQEFASAGGKARAAKMTQERRKEIADKANESKRQMERELIGRGAVKDARKVDDILQKGWWLDGTFLGKNLTEAIQTLKKSGMIP